MDADADAGADDNDDGNDVDDDGDNDVDDATTILIVECVLLASAQVDANSGSLHCVFKLYSLKIFYENSLAAIYCTGSEKKTICEQLWVGPTGPGVTQFKIGLVGTYTS